jgi:CheY-like chemotaxis protein
VVHGILTRHHGSIHLKTQPEQGSTFEISLPIISAEQAEGVSDEIIDVPQQRILIIDDDEEIQRMMSHMLMDHNVHATDAGDKGIQLFHKHRHDVIFTDIGMPGLSGWNVAHVVRQTDPTAVVVAVTGWGKHFASGQRQVSDVDMFLAKPFTREEMLHGLAKAVKLRIERLST